MTSRTALHRTLLLAILLLALPVLLGLRLESRSLPGWADVLLTTSLLALLAGSGAWVWRVARPLPLAGAVPALLRAQVAGPLLLVVRVQLVATVLGVGLDLARVLAAQLSGLPVPDGCVLSGGMLLVTLACCRMLGEPDRAPA